MKSQQAYNYNSTYSSNLYPTKAYPAPTLPLDVDLLKATCSIQGKSGDEGDMIQFIWKQLLDMGLQPFQDKNYNIFVQKGEADVYPTMVAHMDTVHSRVENYEVFVSGDSMFAYNSKKGRMTGVGGDDRCGIAITLQLLKESPYMKAAFFVEEEVGGSKGSGFAEITFFADSSLVLQCDRKEDADWVQTVSGTQVSSNEFIEKIKPLLDKHLYRNMQGGGFTDVGQLKRRGLGVCAANMSCGYYNPHSDQETIHLPTMENTLNLCLSIFQLCGHEKQEHVFVPYVAPKTTYSSSSSNKAYVKRWNYWDDKSWASEKQADNFYRWVKRIAGKVVAGPCMFSDVELMENEYRTKMGYQLTDGTFPKKGSKGKTRKPRSAQAIKDAVTEASSNAEMLALLTKTKEFLAKPENSSWRYIKKDNIWEKWLKNKGAKPEDMFWVVAYADSIYDILEEERHYNIWYGGEYESGKMTAEQISDDVIMWKNMDDEQSETIIIGNKQDLDPVNWQNNLPEIYTEMYDEEVEVVDASITEPPKDDAGNPLPYNCACPECGTIREVLLSIHTTEFWCMGCQDFVKRPSYVDRMKGVNNFGKLRVTKQRQLEEGKKEEVKGSEDKLPAEPESRHPE